MTGNRSRFMLCLLASFLLIATLTANVATRDAQTTTTKQSDRLVVHEWGTFTSVAGKDGVAVEWQPLGGPSDLPEFVYDLNDLATGKGFRHRQNCIKCEEALIRMETPVLYFYSDREMSVSVNVSFPKGKITEWYPQARGAHPQVIDWGRILVMPSAKVAFPAEQNASHYYAARETDSASLRICGTRGEQHEKFLFYRGIGNFDVPLAVTLKDNKLVVKTSSNELLSSIILFENHGGRTGYRVYDASMREMERPALNRSAGELEIELEKMLVSRGLYEKEAKAMIKTWRDSWFDEGLRVFYIVPRKMTDEVLLLNINPQPTELVRVLVGRIELITPETQKAVEDQVTKLKDSAAEINDVAMSIKREHGRFSEPILKSILEKTTDARLRARIERVIKLAGDQTE